MKINGGSDLEKFNNSWNLENSEYLKNSEKEVLALLSEMGTDASIGMLSELATSGEVDVTGIGIDELLTLVTGLGAIKNK